VENEPKTKEIGKYMYIVSPLDAVEASRMLTRIAKIVAPALETIESPDLNKMNMGKLVALILKGVEEKDVDYLRDKFAGMTQVRLERGDVGLKQVLSHHFAGDMGGMLEWMKFSLEVNFGDFFTGLRAKVPAPVPASSATAT
jgi:hypothetical protein